MLAWLGRRIYAFRRVMLIFTAFAPALIVYGVVLLAEHEYAWGVVSILGAGVLWIICIAILRHTVKHSPPIELRPTSVDVADNETIGFLLVYLLPIITRNVTDYNWLAFGVVAAVFALVMAASYTYHFNPLLVLSGWHFYKVNTENNVMYVLVTRDRILRPEKPRSVARLTEYVLIDQGTPQNA